MRIFIPLPTDSFFLKESSTFQIAYNFLSMNLFIIVKEKNLEYLVGIIEDTSRQMIVGFLDNLKGKDFKEN